MYISLFILFKKTTEFVWGGGEEHCVNLFCVISGMNTHIGVLLPAGLLDNASAVVALCATLWLTTLLTEPHGPFNLYGCMPERSVVQIPGEVK